MTICIGAICDEYKSKKEEVLVVEKEKEYDSNLAEARKRLAMIRYEIFSEKYHPSPIIKKKKQRLWIELNKTMACWGVCDLAMSDCKQRPEA